jgi:hypothetical protein
MKKVLRKPNLPSLLASACPEIGKNEISRHLKIIIPVAATQG